MVDKLQSDPQIDSIVKIQEPKGVRGNNIFPQSEAYAWNNDNFGPIYLPQAGSTVALNLNVLPLYKKIIRDYEGNTVSVSGNQVLINGKVADSVYL